jgi:hypothetical protein
VTGFKHGLHGTPEYEVWRSIRRRVGKQEGYKHLDMDPRWHCFEVFLADVGPIPSTTRTVGPSPRQPKGRLDYTLDRKNNVLGYWPGNVQWSTWKGQARNRSNNKNVTFRGQTHCIARWAELTGVNRKILAVRLRLGWSVGRALTTPVRGKNAPQAAPWGLHVRVDD